MEGGLQGGNEVAREGIEKRKSRTEAFKERRRQKKMRRDAN